MVVSPYHTFELLIETYFWLFFIIAPIAWYALRPIADMILKIIAYACLVIGIVGGLLFLLAHL